MSELSIVKLKDTAHALHPIVQWIDQEWRALSGRSFSETHQRFSQELHQDDPLPLTLVALENGIPVGLASLRERDSTDWDPGTTPWVCNVYVNDEARGKGWASKLCEALEAAASEQGYSEMYLATTVSEDSLYHRLGYVQYKKIEGADHSLYLLRKLI